MVSRNKKINELTQNTLQLQDVFPVVDLGTGKTHKASIQDIKDLIGSSGGSASGVRVLDTGPTFDLNGVDEFAILVDTSNEGINCILPPPSLGKHYVFKKIDSSQNTVKISPLDSNNTTIDGETEQNLYQQYQSITVISDGNNWFIL